MSDVVLTRWIAASPGTVFAFFTDIERWSAWQGVGGKVDARPGGALRVIMPDAAAASGRFIEVAYRPAGGPSKEVRPDVPG